MTQFGIDGLSWGSPLALLGTLLATAVVLCPLAIAAILRLTIINQ